MNIIGRFFLDKYLNDHSKSNVVIYLFGRFAYPMAVLFVKLRITPNQITTLSILFALGAAAVLAFDGNWCFFVVLWFLSLLFDFCDGIVARITSQVRQSSFRYDHTSDLFKIFVIVLGVSIRHDIFYLWIISICFIFSFMYYMLLNHDFDSASKINKMRHLEFETNNGLSIKTKENLSLKKRLKKHLEGTLFLKILLGVNAVFFTINGHTLLVFLLFPLGLNTTIIILIYLSILSLYGVLNNIQNLRKIPKI